MNEIYDAYDLQNGKSIWKDIKSSTIREIEDLNSEEEYYDTYDDGQNYYLGITENFEHINTSNLIGYLIKYGIGAYEERYSMPRDYLVSFKELTADKFKKELIGETKENILHYVGRMLHGIYGISFIVATRKTRPERSKIDHMAWGMARAKHLGEAKELLTKIKNIHEQLENFLNEDQNDEYERDVTIGRGRFEHMSTGQLRYILQNTEYGNDPSIEFTIRKILKYRKSIGKG